GGPAAGRGDGQLVDGHRQQAARLQGLEHGPPARPRRSSYDRPRPKSALPDVLPAPPREHSHDQASSTDWTSRTRPCSPVAGRPAYGAGEPSAPDTARSTNGAGDGTWRPGFFRAATRRAATGASPSRRFCWPPPRRRVTMPSTHRAWSV